MVRGTGAYWCLPREGCNSMITISAFKMVPRSPRVSCAICACAGRWRRPAFPHKRSIDPTIQGTAEYRALQPFGQVPIYEERRARAF